MDNGLGLAMLAVLIFGIGLVGVEANEQSKEREQKTKVLKCKADAYDLEQYMDKLGFVKWEAACIKATPNANLEQLATQCMFHIPKCS